MTTNALMELADRLANEAHKWTACGYDTDLSSMLREAAAQLRTAAAEGVRDEDMAMHWIDRYAAGIDETCQLDRVIDALTPNDSGAGRDGSLALEVAYTEARVWKVEAMAARKVCDEWNKSAIAEGYGKGNARACELLDAMDAARKAHEAKEEADTAIAGAAGEPNNG